MVYRFYFKRSGNHTHVRMWVGERAGSLALAGKLAMQNDEFDQFKRLMEKDVISIRHSIEFHEQTVTGLDSPQRLSR